jgi:2,3-bisphosphoglycerate-dependent phosphoglycerate mutase
MPTAQLILVRHCASTAQHPEAPLTEAGAEAAEALPERLARLDPDAVYSSPYARAMATVAPFATRAGLPIQTDDRLRERLLSAEPLDDWLHHIRRSFIEPAYRAPGGESLNDARDRALAALAEIANRSHRLPIVASHGNLISSVLKAMNPAFGFEDWRGLRNPDLFEVTLQGGRPIAYVRLG